MSPSNESTSLGAISSKVYELLQGLEAAERMKVMSSVKQLYGDGEMQASEAKTPPTFTRTGTGAVSDPQALSAQEYFAYKNPQNKGEMLAVAARYREQHGGGDVHQLNDFAAFFVEARQNFDRSHFVRDMKNAQNRAGLFNKGLSRGQYQLSYYGQQYVDALPNREPLAKLKRPTRRANARQQQAKKATK